MERQGHGYAAASAIAYAQQQRQAANMQQQQQQFGFHPQHQQFPSSMHGPPFIPRGPGPAHSPCSNSLIIVPYSSSHFHSCTLIPLPHPLIFFSSTTKLLRHSLCIILLHLFHRRFVALLLLHPLLVLLPTLSSTNELTSLLRLSGPLPSDVTVELGNVLNNLNGTKESIKGAKLWFMKRSPFAPALAEALRDRVFALDEVERQLHIIYLANDILFDSYCIISM
ncbi:hypothetical protein RJT34_32667 [Clitoria ternatea]|uniref:CID domain-containing protein n=1 Tax=Clitoria ternatea TaxID=43366 RepID=A0AAN9EYR1_CLITE